MHIDGCVRSAAEAWAANAARRSCARRSAAIHARGCDGVGRTVLRREIAERLDEASAMTASANVETEAGDGSGGGQDLEQVIDDLKRLEGTLLELKVSKTARQLMFRLIETLQKESQKNRTSLA